MTTIAITGANRGIGLALVRHYANQGNNVVSICRNASPALEATSSHVETGVDLTDETAVAAVCRRLSGLQIDVVIHNAGVMERNSLDALDFDSVRRQFEVNAIAPLRLSLGLLPLIPQGGKIAVITSRMGSIADNSSGGSYGYRMSKAAINIAGVSLAQDLRSRSIAVAILHPGFVRTDMTGGQGHTTPDLAAKALAQRIEELTLETTGLFRHANGEILPW